ncbi:MAG: DNA-3-methyladenine glycosylase family protein [Christensenellales bacterium]|jgi:N-glycosylase/DNA lyase
MRLSVPGLDLARLADSGQCFRLLPMDKNRWGLIAHGRQLIITDTGQDNFDFSCSQLEFERIWKIYFDLDRDYDAIIAMASPNDGYLYQAAQHSKGLRILRQEPFETLISFIISQRKTVGAIRHCVRLLCESYGKQIGEDAYAFPKPGELAKASLEGLSACGLGYRAKYVQRASRMVLEGNPDLEALHQLPDEEMLAALVRLPGVGVKVASCVMLFAYHRMDAFPVDVWIDRVLRREFPEGFPFERFPGVAGIFQQYLFCYAREQARGKLVK